MSYIQELNLEERINFLTILAHTMHADGMVEAAEKTYLEVAAKAYFIPAEKIEEAIAPHSDEEIFKLAETLETPQARRYLIREMLSIAYADGHFAEEEREMIFDLAEHLGISNMRAEDLLSWVIDSFELQVDGNRLIEESDEDDFEDDDLD